MDKHSENTTPFDLISKVITGDASLDEIQALEQWRSLNDENESEFQTLATILNSTPEELPEFNTNKAWEAVNAATSEAAPKVNKFKYYLGGIAASVILVLGLFLTQESNSVNFVASVDGEELKLSDGSVITLKKGAEIEYTKSFDANERVVHLKGEAFFLIERDTTKPFIVHTKDLDVQVLGTSFNIKEENNTSEVVVATGKVEVKSQQNPDENAILTKGERITWDQSLMRIQKSKQLNPLSTYYATKTLVFNATRLSEVVKVLSVVYDCNVSLQCSEIGDQHFNGEFNDIPIAEAVKTLAFMMNASTTFENGNYILTHQQCD